MRRPVPRVALERRDQRLQLVEQLLAPRHRERADHADRGQRAVVVVQAEQQRTDRVRPALVHPVAGDHAVGGALVLDLEHHPLVRLVGAVERLGDDAVQPGALELGEPALRRSSRSVVAGVTWTARRAARQRAARDAARRSANGRPVRSSSPSASRSKAMNDAGVCSASRVTRDAAGWMRCCSASKSSPSPVAITISPSTTHRSGSSARERLDQLREVAGHRLLVAAADLDLVAVAEDQRPEPVPLRLVGARRAGSSAPTWRASARPAA